MEVFFFFFFNNLQSPNSFWSQGCPFSVSLTTVFLSVLPRKHDDDRRFVCTEEGCGKSFTRAEHLKGHSITHLGTKPFQCHAEGISKIIQIKYLII